MKNNIIILSFLLSTKVYSSKISSQEFLDNIAKNFPVVQNQLLKIQQSEAKLQEAEGSFDSNLTIVNKQYLDGLYDSNISEIAVTKPLKFYNSKIEFGHRRSDGKIPVYYAEHETVDGGENFLRFQTSLLRFREIDPKRFKLFLSKNNIAMEKLNYALKLMDIKSKANKLFWKWSAISEKEKIYKNLVELNQQRFNAIDKRVQKKDLAKIYLVESEEYLLGFKSELAQIQATKNMTKNILRYFDSTINSETVAEYNIPNDSIEFKVEIESSLDKVSKRPELKILDILLSNNKLSLQGAKQNLMPKLNLKFEYNESSRSFNQELGDELLVGLNLEIPFERNLGKGEVSKIEIENKILNNQKMLLSRELSYQLNNYQEQINGLILSFNFILKEVNNAKILQEAEWKKFKAGTSDFFLLNTRDMNFAKAQVRLIEHFAHFKSLKFDLQQFIESFDY